MNAKQLRITRKLLAIGASWAVRTDKYCGPNDPIEDQIKGRKTYHIHPDSTYPHENYILRFTSLAAIEEWLSEVGQ